MHKERHKLKTSPIIKNPQFSSNLADIKAKLPTHEIVILTKFHKYCKRIVDFLLTQKFLVCVLFYASPFKTLQPKIHNPSPSELLWWHATSWQRGLFTCKNPLQISDERTSCCTFVLFFLKDKCPFSYQRCIFVWWCLSKV